MRRAGPRSASGSGKIKAVEALSQALAQSVSREIRPAASPDDGGVFVVVCPRIDFAGYVKRVLWYLELDEAGAVILFCYVRRLAERWLRPGTQFKLVAAAAVVAMKWWEDDVYNNGFCAHVAGVTLREMNALEREVLVGIGYGCHVGEAEYREGRAMLRGLVVYHSPSSPRRVEVRPRSGSPGSTPGVSRGSSGDVLDDEEV